VKIKTLLEEERLEAVIKKMRRPSFTILDFIPVLKRSYSQDWKRLMARFGEFGEKRRYTITIYLSNRLDFYSHKPGSLLVPFLRYSQAGFKGYRRTTERERKIFGSPWIAVFRKKR
jgi:hypothetical protein